MPKPTDLMTANDVAKVAGVSPAAVRLWERNGKLPAERTVGGMRLFRSEDVTRMVAERGVTLAAKAGVR